MALQKGSFVRVADDNWHFEEIRPGAEPAPFVPIGVNYFAQGIGWAPKVWTQFRPDAFKEDFPLMREMGMNVIRVFLSIAPFIPEDKVLSDEAMSKCRTMLDLAAEHDIRIIFSGPSAWEGTPDWMRAPDRTWQDYFTDEQILDNLDYFYQEFGKEFGDHPALFSYDLSNEPHMVWDRPSRREAWIRYLKEKYGSLAELNAAWAPRARIDDWDDIQVAADANDRNSPIIWDYQMFKNYLSRNFIERCVNAIRRHDTNHMVSIGCHQGTVAFDMGIPSRYFAFDPHFVGDLLDYISIHWYPYDDRMDIFDDPKNFEKNMAFLMGAIKYMYVGKPIILEEYGLYGGGVAPDFPWRKPFKYISQETQADWVLGVMERSKGFCSGWLNWGFRDYPEAKDPTRYQGFFDDDGNLKELGRRFPEVAKRVRGWVAQNPRTTGSRRIPLPLKEILTDGKRAIEYQKIVMEEFQKSTDIEFDVLKD
ncbi:MAG: beta-galactosidase [Bacillota bacterium]|jgi:hypothetical protein|nr:cellulase family glycosylhydrolase [Bacillota bacterium]HOB90969.1 beta-galactosidase [Bacillota bacterium]HPZ54983.1 beta-galactosidase [Bacillota bacterium]